MGVYFQRTISQASNEVFPKFQSLKLIVCFSLSCREGNNKIKNLLGPISNDLMIHCFTASIKSFLIVINSNNYRNINHIWMYFLCKHSVNHWFQWLYSSIPSCGEFALCHLFRGFVPHPDPKEKFHKPSWLLHHIMEFRTFYLVFCTVSMQNWLSHITVTRQFNLVDYCIILCNLDFLFAVLQCFSAVVL